jgi:hypothetical protein
LKDKLKDHVRKREFGKHNPQAVDSKDNMNRSLISMNEKENQEKRDSEAYTTFLNWIMKDTEYRVSDIYTDLKNGEIVCILAHKLTGKPFKFNKNTKMIQRIRENFHLAFESLKGEVYAKAVRGISAEGKKKTKKI